MKRVHILCKKTAASLMLQAVVHIVTTRIYEDMLEKCTDDCDCGSMITSHVPVLTDWCKTGGSTNDVLFALGSCDRAS